MSFFLHFIFLFPAEDMHFQSRFAPNMCRFASSFTELLAHFGFRTPLGACQIIVVLLMLFTVIAHKHGTNHPRDWMFPTSKLRAENAAPICSAFYLTCSAWRPISIQMASHQGFYTFTLSKNAEQKKSIFHHVLKESRLCWLCHESRFPLGTTLRQPLGAGRRQVPYFWRVVALPKGIWGDSGAMWAIQN